MSRAAAVLIRRGMSLALVLCLGALLFADPLHFRTGGNSLNTTFAIDQRFHVGDPATALDNVFISCNGLVITDANNLRIVIPPSGGSGSNFEFDDTLPHATLGGPNAGLVTAPSVTGLANSFPDAGLEKTFFLNTVDFAVGNNFTVNGLRVRNFTAPSPPAHMSLNVGGLVTPSFRTDTAWIMVANNPSVSLPDGTPADMSPGDPNAPLGRLRIREANVTPGAGEPFNGAIWATTDIRLTIVNGTGVTWDTSSPISVDLPGKVSAAFDFTTDVTHKTVFINVTSDFAQNEAVTITGLRFNLASSAPDGPFDIEVRCGAAGNNTAHATLSGQCNVKGLPTIVSSGASSVFTVGDPPSGAQTITVTESSGSPKITAAGDLRVTIPSNFDMEWDTAGPAPTAAVSGAGTGAVNATVTVEPLTNNKTLLVNVTSDLSANQVVTISNARFANFTGREPADGFLQLEVGAIAGPDAVDSRGLRISQPTIQSANDHIFLVNQGATNTIQTITLTEDATNPRIVNGTQIRLRMPSTSIAFAGTNPTLSGNLGGTISFEDPVTGGFQTMRVTCSTALGAGGTATISNIPVVAGSPAIASNFRLFMSGSASAAVTSTDPALLVVGSLPTMSSPAQQFTVNDPVDGVKNVASTITINTNAGSAPLFQATNSLEIVIPSALNLEWRTSVQPTIGGSAAGKCAATVTFPGPAPFKTMRLLINNDWVSPDDLTFTGAQFIGFTGASAPPGTSLQLRVRIGGPFAATDANPKAIGAPTILSGANQIFGKLDPATTMSPIVIADDPVTNRIGSAAAFVRVRIPAGFNMFWGTAPSASVSGAGTGAVGTPFIESAQVVRIPVTTPFSGVRQITLSGGTFTFNGSTSTASNLELEVNNTASVIPNAFDGRTILVGTRPTVTSVFTGDANGGSANGAIDRLILTFSENINASSLSATTGLGFTVTGFNISQAAVPGPLPNNVLVLSIAETGLADSSLTPAVVYDPLVGDLYDLDDVLEMTQAPPPTQDGTPPMFISIATSDFNGNGFLDQVRLTFSEPLSGTPDITRFILVDADGTTNLLQGLTSLNFVINGSVLEINLLDSIGTTGVPRFQYVSTGPGGVLTDVAGNTLPTLTNNNPPIASAGPDQTVIPSVVILDGSASFDPDGAQTLTYLWSEVSRPVGAPAIVFADPASKITSFIPTTAGQYVVQLQVSDLIGSSSATAVITVLQVAPVSDPVLQVANVPVGTAPFHRGILSTDINGDLDFGLPTASFWSVISKPATSAAAFSFPNSEAGPNFIPDVPGVYELAYTATDAAMNASAPKPVRVTASGGGVVPPYANAGPDMVVQVGVPCTLDGRQSWTPNPANSYYLWTRPDSTTTLGSTMTFTPPGPGLYTFKLVVTDTTPVNAVDSAPDFVTVMAFNKSNLPPVAFASKFLPAGDPVIGDVITLDSTGSLDPEGHALSYSWTQVAGPTAALSNPAAAKPKFSPALPGLYEFQLTVFDGTQVSLPARLVIQVRPDASYVPITVSPSVTGTAGVLPGHFMAGSPVTLVRGPVSGSVTDTWWEQLGGPTLAFTFQVDLDLVFTPTVAGTYTFQFTALDFSPPNNFVQVKQILHVVIDEPGPGNTAPDANAGATQSGVAPGSVVTLDGTGSSADATTYYWSQLAGPPVALSDPHASKPTFTAAAGVTYAFQLVVVDASGASSAPSIMNVVVDPAPVSIGGGGGGRGGGCGLTFEPLILLGLIAWARRRSR